MKATMREHMAEHSVRSGWDFEHAVTTVQHSMRETMPPTIFGGNLGDKPAGYIKGSQHLPDLFDALDITILKASKPTHPPTLGIGLSLVDSLSRAHHQSFTLEQRDHVPLHFISFTTTLICACVIVPSYILLSIFSL